MPENSRDIDKKMASLFPPSNHPDSARLRTRRRLKDTLAKHLIGVGGISVILAVTLIFVYLLWVVLPLFMPGSIELAKQYRVSPQENFQTNYLAMEEQAEIGVRFDSAAQATFFSTQTGDVVLRESLMLPTATQVSSFGTGTPETRIIAYGLSDGSAIVAKHDYQISYPDDKRLITPVITYPLGAEPIEIDAGGRALNKIAVQYYEDAATLVGLTDDGELLLTSMTIEASLLGDEPSVEVETTSIDDAPQNISHILLEKDQRLLYLASTDGTITAIDISEPDAPVQLEQVKVVEDGASILSAVFLTGDISLLIGDSRGVISQWFPVRDDNNRHHLSKVREFKMPQGVLQLTPEYFRKGFIAIDQSGQLNIFHSTAQRNVLQHQLSSRDIAQVALSPRANAALVESASGDIRFFRIHNEHPEVSWSSLWGKVWYESYQEADYVWQSSSASNDFEPKFSLVPISFGTIKAAFYAMLFAVPLAILGAIYTAYFMTPKMRSTVKPTIEIMEALPTVILGFLAGLWLAPMLEFYLPGVFTLLLLLPLSILVSSYLWHVIPGQIRNRVPDGWTAALLVPVIIFATWASFAISPFIEAWFFGGDMRAWMDHELGIDFDQRNAMVVGIAMGFAVIPTIFSITEDAIFGVPKHLSNGSLALGATPWQTLTRVVLLTASPGIFTAVMIGFGRAVGETMIVLMATGNTPLMDLSIFQGMRTLSANIAVEMPESELGSTHYRILFLAALVLFAFTFFVNTIAEVVRQRLRQKYSSL